jgi:hypothetical protein
MANSILPDEDLLDDDISCDTYSNSTYSSFWSMGAFRESPYSPNWSVNTVFSGSCNTSIWYVDTYSKWNCKMSLDLCMYQYSQWSCNGSR